MSCQITEEYHVRVLDHYLEKGERLPETDNKKLMFEITYNHEL